VVLLVHPKLYVVAVDGRDKGEVIGGRSLVENMKLFQRRIPRVK
jgi:hypothetical protein